jgi:hypothetical protein
MGLDETMPSQACKQNTASRARTVRRTKRQTQFAGAGRSAHWTLGSTMRSHCRMSVAARALPIVLLGSVSACLTPIDFTGKHCDSECPLPFRCIDEVCVVPSDAGSGPAIAGCPILPTNHIFNTRIDTLPVHPSSAAFMSTIGTVNLHLDLGTTEDQTAADYYGIPYNVVNASTLTWADVSYTTVQPGYTWTPRDQSDCATGSAHDIDAPCTSTAAQLPIPTSPLIENGVLPDVASSPDADHHVLVLDAKTCRVWEAYHAYTASNGVWNIFGSATFDLTSNALRRDTWASGDQAGFPILPLLLRANEASAGAINHALRFGLPRTKIRGTYVWPARHPIGDLTSTSLPPMGQLFRLKSSYAIPASFDTQARAVLQAMQRYGIYLAFTSSPMFVSGEPKAVWSSTLRDQVQSVSTADFEAVDMSTITSRAGFDPNSAAVPP